MSKQFQFLLALVLIIALSSCKPSGPEPINFGKDQCDFCKMTISNPKFGAELITKKGRVRKYDATECVVNQLEEEKIEHSGIYAIAYDQPKKLKPVDSLHFVISKDFRSPMGADLAAFSEKKNLSEEHQSGALSWSELLKKLNQ